MMESGTFVQHFLPLECLMLLRKMVIHFNYGKYVCLIRISIGYLSRYNTVIYKESGTCYQVPDSLIVGRLFLNLSFKSFINIAALFKPEDARIRKSGENMNK
mgnify:CR=1 FL=1